MKKFFLCIVLLCGIICQPNSLQASERFSLSQIKTGVLAEEMKKEFEFYGKENESILITLFAEDDLWYMFQIFGDTSSAPIQYVRVSTNQKKEVIFTPLSSKKYIIRLTGLNQYGKYRLEARKIGMKSSQNLTRRITTNQTRKEVIAEGQVHTYEFYGKKNTPLIFYTKREEKIWYYFQIIDIETESIIQQKRISYDGWVDAIFTPQESKKYQIKVTGVYDFGEYLLNMQKIPTH